MNKRVLILNGPKGVGKDFLMELLAEHIIFHHIEFKRTLVEMVKTIYSLTQGEFEYLSLRENKEKKFKRLGGKSIRDCMIEVSEKVIKQFYGKDFFGKKALEDCCDILLNIATDGGFVPEVMALVEGGAEVVVIRLHKEGYDFEGDSRGYLPDLNCYTTYDVENDWSDDVVKRVLHIIERGNLL